MYKYCTLSFVANSFISSQLLILKTSRLYRVFGSGSFHAPHAQFQDEVITANHGRAANLLRAAKTRMSYFFYAMHRSLRLSPQLLATVHSAKWEALKLNKPLIKRAVEDIKDKLHWKRVYVLLRAVWPVLKLLRIADSDKPGMDKIYYLCHKAKEAMAASSELLNDTDLFPTELDLSDAEADANYSDSDDEDEVEEEDAEEEVADEAEEVADDDDDNSDDDEEEVIDVTSMAGKCAAAFKKRTKKVMSAFAVTGWICSIDPVVREDVEKRFKKSLHGPLVEGVIRKLYAHKSDTNIGEMLNRFWKEWKDFKNETGIYEKSHIWNVKDAREGNSAIWHEAYSHEVTKVFGFVACRVTSKGVGMGASERAWGNVKEIKTGQRVGLSGKKVEALSIISQTHRLHQARVLRQLRETFDCIDKHALWGEEDERFDLALDKFGVNVSALRVLPSAPKRILRCWVEDWEKECIKKNDAVAKMKLLQKYRGLTIEDPDHNMVFTLSSENMDWVRGRNGGWHVVAEPAEYDGTNDDVLEIYEINEESLMWMIINTEQPPKLNIQKVYKDDINSDGEEVGDTARE